MSRRTLSILLACLFLLVPLIGAAVTCKFAAHKESAPTFHEPAPICENDGSRCYASITWELTYDCHKSSLAENCVTDSSAPATKKQNQHCNEDGNCEYDGDPGYIGQTSGKKTVAVQGTCDATGGAPNSGSPPFEEPAGTLWYPQPQGWPNP